MRRRHGLESLESRSLLTGIPFGATPEDTAEYLLGDVHVNVVLMESTGEIDPSTEDWTPELIAETKQKVVEGIDWWKDALQAHFSNSVHELNFHYDFTFADAPFATAYEPIARVSQDFRLWVQEFLDHVGFGNLGTGDVGISKGIRAFNHAERVATGSDWAFTLFVANSENDADGRFAPGSDFSRAFAFAGGRFFISPSTRPASTYAHEMGHIFYALDEHSGGADYSARRGYYNTQNLNASRNHPDPDSRVPSIMDDHEEAFPTYAISPSAREMLGWRDSDGDGIFDVLDVPLSLTGSGSYDPDSGLYRFVGHASVETLRNLNQSSLQSDITINEVSRIQYRIDGGAWIDAVQPHAYEADLDLTFPVPAGSQNIEIRAVDDATNGPGEQGVVSAVFRATAGQPAATVLPGVNGFLWGDEDGDGQRDPDEDPLAGWTVEVRGPSGQRLELERRIEPDDFADDEDLSTSLSGVKLTASGTAVASATVSVRSADAASTGSKVFAHQQLTGSQPTWTTEWTGESRQLMIEFDEPVTTVSIDAVSDNGGDYGRLQIYDANFQLIDRVTTRALDRGQSATMTLSRPTAEIKYAIASGHAGSTVRLDNLRFGPQTTVVTDANGAWSAPYLDSGDFTVQAAAPAGWRATSPGSASQAVSLTSGEAVENVAFGFEHVGLVWHNAENPPDVTRDGQVTNLDLLAIVQYLRDQGVGAIEGEPSGQAPLVDADGDGVASPNDLLVVIGRLRTQIESQASGEQEAAASHASGLDSISDSAASSPSLSGASPSAEAEAPAPVGVFASERRSAPSHSAEEPRRDVQPSFIKPILARPVSPPRQLPLRALVASQDGYAADSLEDALDAIAEDLLSNSDATAPALTAGL